ncbi:MAG: DUF1134 domain-containing protein [Desulfofustis sp. PB-SRB1]|jgi:hypothetical protein|nr:DUF1134 domain-containing protein [Desulfofustis sp. PB-SRB1]MBM1002894.1 DUF1134 domain-containing protein [Desulfofustis sp. PB-SRB1]HBH30002.1 DUF1134 domain-containing protein [Desulfofustis sp.]
MERVRKLFGVITIALVSLCLVSVVQAEDAKPVGTVTIDTKAIAIGVGYSWGGGVLSFEGNDYPFEVKGLSIIDVGVSNVSAVGDVYKLEKVEDFAGTFSAAEAGIALGGGAGAQIMENQNGVLIKLTSTKQGVQLKLAPEGLSIKMQ